MSKKIENDEVEMENMIDGLAADLTAQMVSAYVSNNKVEAAQLPELIETVYQSVSGICSGRCGKGQRPDPAVPVDKSVTPEYIVCLEDGRKLKMLKRHLKSSYNMSPDEYRERWGLRSDYPMVAPNYTKQRSKLAKQIGLGTSRKGSKKAA